MKCKVGVLVPVCAQAHKQQAQAAKNQVGKCGARYLCASGQGGSRPEPQPAVTVQLYIRHLEWRLYLATSDWTLATEDDNHVNDGSASWLGLVSNARFGLKSWVEDVRIRPTQA